MKKHILASIASISLLTAGCDLDVGSGTSTSELAAARSSATSGNTAQNATQEDDTAETDNGTKTAGKPTSTPTVTPTPTPAPAPAPVAPVAPVAPPVSTGGALYQAGGNSLTLRSDFAAVAARVDALVNINDPRHKGAKSGSDSSTAVAATRSGNTWILPQALASYPVGNRPNTWRIALSGTPPAGVTYHTSINQSFIPTDYFGTGKTYPPTTRQ